MVYYHLVADVQTWLMTLFDKDEMADLSPAEKRLLQTAIAQELQRARRGRPRRK